MSAHGHDHAVDVLPSTCFRPEVQSQCGGTSSGGDASDGAHEALDVGRLEEGQEGRALVGLGAEPEDRLGIATGVFDHPLVVRHGQGHLDARFQREPGKAGGVRLDGDQSESVPVDGRHLRPDTGRQLTAVGLLKVTDGSVAVDGSRCQEPYRGLRRRALGGQDDVRDGGAFQGTGIDSEKLVHRPVGADHGHGVEVDGQPRLGVAAEQFGEGDGWGWCAGHGNHPMTPRSAVS